MNNMKILAVSQSSMPTPSPSDKIFAPGVFCYQLVKGLKKRGHEVKLIAAQDSRHDEIDIEGFGINSTDSQKELPVGIRNYRVQQHELFALASAFEEFSHGDYDLLHLNSFPIASYFTKLVDGPITCTYHGSPTEDHDLKTDIDKLRQKKYFDEMNFIAISEKQREMGRNYFNFCATIHHGVDIDHFVSQDGPKDKLLFAGRMKENKNPHLAIQAAIQAGRPIDLYGTFDEQSTYYLDTLKPLMEHELVSYNGCASYDAMPSIYASARALLVPISWDEPFGMVMIEAMACGTPMIAFNKGSVSEIIKDGINGFVVEEGDVAGMAEAIKKIDQIDRNKCREDAVQYFSLDRMVNDYEKLFIKLISESKKI